MSKAYSKNAYINQNEISERIENGQLDAFDIIYTKDTHLCFIISPELTPIEIKSKVFVFTSVEEAEEELNNSSYTYEGQIVSILSNGIYRAYIVNKNYRNIFYVTSLADSSIDLDYNNLGNKPIINLTGTIDNRIILDTLPNGIYTIDGTYKISANDETIYSSAVKNIFIIQNSNSDSQEVKNIKKVSSTGITDFSIYNDSVKSSSYLTTEKLKEYGYITENDVDVKLSVLDYITKEEAQHYIEDAVIASIDESIDTRIDQKLNEKIQETSAEEISNLFGV